ncbi:transposase [Rhizobium sp. Root708]|uniref:helix-turn-helix domain-containing protein n=1 Tax=Rhizobium sp. Root708 TaxID=1736592 RepID=UPI0006FA2A86|nr:helix-turn-helix domain-containing protein [Rhizobium sp. Root708]KRB50141.1 transposase [Rhizobium sp. Root708]
MPIGNVSPPAAGAAPPIAAAAIQLESKRAPAPATLPSHAICRICAEITGEMASLVGARIQRRRDRRRASCHIRQIAMYVCHVALQIPLHEIGRAFGRDRTTVGHACHVVEDRRDDPDFDEFVSTVERTVGFVFRSGGEAHE